MQRILQSANSVKAFHSYKELGSDAMGKADEKGKPQGPEQPPGEGDKREDGSLSSNRDSSEGVAPQALYTQYDVQTLCELQRGISMHQRQRGMKRGRKVQGFTEYCEKTTERINELKALLHAPSTTEPEKKQIRN